MMFMAMCNISPLVVALWLAVSARVDAAVQTNALFSDHMVLQTGAEGGRPGSLYGTASPGECMIRHAPLQFARMPYTATLR